MNKFDPFFTDPEPGDTPGAAGFSLALFRRANTGVVMSNTDGRVTFVNDNACALLGLDGPDAARGLIWDDLWSDVDRAETARARLSDGSAFRGALVAYRTNRPLEVTVTPVGDDGALTTWLIELEPATGDIAG